MELTSLENEIQFENNLTYLTRETDNSEKYINICPTYSNVEFTSLENEIQFENNLTYLTRETENSEKCIKICPESKRPVVTNRFFLELIITEKVSSQTVFTYPFHHTKLQISS